MATPAVGGDFTVKEFARKTQQSEQSVYRKIRAGLIPSYKVGGAVRIRREDVEKIRQASRRPEATVTDFIRRLVDEAPEFTADQRVKLAELLAPVRRTATGSGDLGA